LTGANELIDDAGHGTAVAGVVGSKTYGMAKKTQLYAIKVMKRDGLARSSAILDGILYANNNRTQNCPNGSVVNISVGITSTGQSLNDAVRNALGNLNET
jgi:subtilisin family serine protease